MSPDSLPDDANDLRGAHFKQLISKQTTWLAIAIAIVVAGTAGAAIFSPVVGSAAGVGVLLISLIVVFVIADSRAADDFFAVYAQQRGMQLAGRSRLPAATPLLRKGDDRYAERLLSGPLAVGVEGMLALYTYEDETTDSDGDRQTNYYRYTLGLIEIPECTGHVPELYCQRKSGLRALEKFEDVFRGSKERVKLESEALDKKYEIFVREGQDANWLHQLFSPTFIVWLTDSAPNKFAFELVDGSLCCYVDGHKENAKELDLVSQATAAVASRLREEANE